MLWLILSKGKNIVNIEVYFDGFKYGCCLFSNFNGVMMMRNSIILNKTVVSVFFRYIFTNDLNTVNLFEMRMRLVMGRGSDE